MESVNPTILLNQTSAVVLAAAAIELFPGTQIVQGEGTGEYFFHDFVFPFEFRSEFLPLIEERMRLILREKRPLRNMEMVPANAAALMEHGGQKIAAAALMRSQEATVQMVQMGDFAARCQEPLLEKPPPFQIKILDGYSIKPKMVRIVGSAALDKKTLNEIAKQPSPSSRSHITLAIELNLLYPMQEEGKWCWSPKGERVRHLLEEQWRGVAAEEKLNFIFSFVSKEEEILRSHQDYFQRQNTAKIAQMTWINSEESFDSASGLISPKAFYADRIHLFCPNEKLLEECISSLRFILKIPRILGFEFEIVLSVSSEGPQKSKVKGSAILRQALEKMGLGYTTEKKYRYGVLASIDIRIPDALGRKWTGPYLRVLDTPISNDKEIGVAVSAMGSMERMCALLLEKTEGNIPLWLAPEQVRIIVLGKEVKEYAHQIEEALEAQGFRIKVQDQGQELKELLYRAMREKVPYILLIGEREKKAKSLTVRSRGKKEMGSLSLNEFCTRLKREMESGNSEFKN